MKILLTTILFISSMQTFAKRDFKFNYKNLNTLGLYLCHLNEVPNSKRELTHRTEIDINQNGPLEKNKIITITGTCSADKSSKDIGTDLSLEIDLNSQEAMSGTIGLSNVEINFKLNKVTTVNLIDGVKRSYSLSTINWAQANSNFLLSEKNKIQARSKSLKISEDKSSLKIVTLKKKTVVTNAWSYEATAKTFLN